MSRRLRRRTQPSRRRRWSRCKPLRPAPTRSRSPRRPEGLRIPPLPWSPCSSVAMHARCDILVIGGGIVGLSTAMELTRRFPRLRLFVAEKETDVARHQSGHNSGVIHSGIYYKPGSLKARMCVEGARLMVEFCREHSIPHQICGKLIVATTEEELPRLDELRVRGEANGISGIRVLRREELR